MSKIESLTIKPQVNFTEGNSEYLIINNDVENNLDSKYNSIIEFLSNNEGKGKSEEEKDLLYNNAQTLCKEFGSYLKEAKYNFNLNKTQWNFLLDLIQNNIEYDVNTVFFAIELTELLNGMKDTNFDGETQLFPFKVNATEITYIYHLISTHKVKGLSQDAYTFSEVLRRIGDISKIFNYYENLGKEIANDVQDWVACFDENVSRDTTFAKTILPSCAE